MDSNSCHSLRSTSSRTPRKNVQSEEEEEEYMDTHIQIGRELVVNLRKRRLTVDMSTQDESESGNEKGKAKIRCSLVEEEARKKREREEKKKKVEEKEQEERKREETKVKEKEKQKRKEKEEKEKLVGDKIRKIKIELANIREATSREQSGKLSITRTEQAVIRESI